MGLYNPSTNIATPVSLGQGGTASTTSSGALSTLGIVASTVGMQKIISLAVSSATSVSLPANCYVDQIFVKNNTATAVTGGLKFGTTSGAVDIVAALTVAGSVISPPATMLLTKFVGAQTIFVDAVVAWAGTNVDITIVYGQL